MARRGREVLRRLSLLGRRGDVEVTGVRRPLTLDRPSRPLRGGRAFLRHGPYLRPDEGTSRLAAFEQRQGAEANSEDSPNEEQGT